MKRLFLVFMLTMFIVILSACGRTQSFEDVFDASGLAKVQSEGHLRSLIGTTNNQARFAETDDVDMDADHDGTTEQEPNHSSTNVQVEGIDEADIVKTDGNAIYLVQSNQLRVIDVADGLEQRFMKSYDLNEYGYYRDLYLTDTYLVAIGSYHQLMLNDSRPEPGIDISWDDSAFRYGYFHGRTVSTIEIFDKTTMELVTTYEIEGNIQTSRLMGDDLYVITSRSVYQDDDEVRPFYSIDGNTFYPDFDAIRYLPEVHKGSYTIISHIALSSAPKVSHEFFLGAIGWGTVYMSHNNIYFVTYIFQSSTRDSSRSDDDSLDEPVDSASGSGIFSLVMSFEILEDGTVEYGGHGKFKGHIVNQFSIDEYDGYLRLVSTEGWGINVVNRLYVFERVIDDGTPKLNVVSLLDEGIGKPEETVRSVRFQGELVTVVTFVDMDPFYTIDLSDPINPVILGELDEIPGFAVYQHPWENDTVIGVGYETNEQGWTIGLKLTLFDISDRYNPSEIGTPLVLLNESQGWQYGEALHNHRAILVSKPHHFIGFAINSSSWQVRYENHSNYMIFSIDAEADEPITIAATISHNHLDTEEADDYYYYNRVGVQRAIVINDTLYVISNFGITSHDINDDFETIETHRFE